MPIAGPIGSSPVELELMTRKQPAGKDHDEALRGIGNVGDHAVDHGVCASDERPVCQSDRRVVEHPPIAMLIDRMTLISLMGSPDWQACPAETCVA